MDKLAPRASHIPLFDSPDASLANIIKGSRVKPAGRAPVLRIDVMSTAAASTSGREARQILLCDKHAAYIRSLDKLPYTATFEYAATEHLRMNGVYWGCAAMDLLGRLGEMDKARLVPWLLRCQQPNGGFGGEEGHDAHMLHTLSAVQVSPLSSRGRRGGRGRP